MVTVSTEDTKIKTEFFLFLFLVTRLHHRHGILDPFRCTQYGRDQLSLHRMESVVCGANLCIHYTFMQHLIRPTLETLKPISNYSGFMSSFAEKSATQPTIRHTFSSNGHPSPERKKQQQIYVSISIYKPGASL